MIYTQEYNLNLTGTNFGLLSAFPRSEYIDGYFFNDLFLSSNITYSNELSTNSFLDFLTNSEVANLSGLILWLDVQDSSTLSTSGKAITAIRDKSTNNYLFSCLGGSNFISNSALSAFWPIYSLPLSSTYLTPKRCVRITKNSAFFNDKFAFSANSPFSIYYIWKDLNSTNYSIPFAIKTIYDSVTGELVAINQYTPNILIPEQITWGLRETSFGIRVSSVSGKFFEENIFNFTYDSTSFLDISSKSLSINNIPLVITDNIILTGSATLSGTSIGYLSGNNNDFLFGEILVFNRLLSKEEDINLNNYLFNKWNMFNYFTSNVSITAELSGGQLSNNSYEDYSVLTSNIQIPIQSCVTRLTVNLESFDQSASKINKVVYEYNRELTEVTSTYTDNVTSLDITLETPTTDFILMPDNDRQISTYFIYLSVYRYDSTINKLILSGNIAKCSLLDFNSNTKLLDSQIVDNPKEVLLVLEDKNQFATFTNILNVSLPIQALSGGDVEPLVNKEVVDVEERVILIDDLLEDEAPRETRFRTPGIPPTPSPRINPIRPS